MKIIIRFAYISIMLVGLILPLQMENSAEWERLETFQEQGQANAQLLQIEQNGSHLKMLQLEGSIRLGQEAQ